MELPLSLSYKSDLSEALQLLIDVVKSHPKVEAAPPPSALVTELGNTSVNVTLRFFVANQSLRATVTSDMIVSLATAFADAGTSGGASWTLVPSPIAK